MTLTPGEYQVLRDRRELPILVLGVVVFFQTRADGDVIGSAAHGFRIEIKIEISGSRQQVYDGFVERIGQWWEPGHTYSGDSSNLYIEAEKKGWFGERLPDGGFVQHLRVVYVQPGAAIRLTGGLGPLQEMGVDGALTISLKENAEGQTELTLIYNVSGYDPEGLDRIAGPVDQVLIEQMHRLKNFVER